jgi:hypothetical protein
MLPATNARVERKTRRSINRRNERDIERSVAFYASHPEAIPGRLAELDREWDMERTLEANAATIGLAGVLLGAFLDRRLLAIPAAVTGFLLQHALQGWCPPVPLFRRRGVRTAAEIERERTALKALRGDFKHVSTSRRRSARLRPTAAKRRQARHAVHAARPSTAKAGAASH